MKLASRIFRRTDWYVTSAFGWRTYTYNGKKVTDFHRGNDYGTNIENWNQYALEEGIVDAAGSDNTSGNYVWVRYPRLGFRLLHCHLKDVYVKSGQNVNANTVLGTTGTTGMSTGVHLHLGMQYLSGGAYVDPYQYDYQEYIEPVKPKGDIRHVINDAVYIVNYDWTYKGNPVYPVGTEVEVIDANIVRHFSKNYPYVKVRVDGREGYMCTDYLSNSEIKDIRKVAQGGLWLISFDYKKVKVFQEGTEVEVLQENYGSHWGYKYSKVKVDNQEGLMCPDYLIK